MRISEHDITLANKRRELREAHDNKCFYCRRDFSNRPYVLTIHHRDFRAYLEGPNRDPFDRKLAKPACNQCHLAIHRAAATITLGLMKSIPVRLLRDVLIQEAKLSRHLVNCVIKDLCEIGISKKEIVYASNLTINRILKHARDRSYFDDMEQMLDDALNDTLNAKSSSS